MASSRGCDASKSALRSGYLALGARMSPRQRKAVERGIADHLRALPEYRACDLLLAYAPFEREVSTDLIVSRARKEGKRVALPAFWGGDQSMKYFLVGEGVAMVRGRVGYPEPQLGEGALPLAPEDMAGSVCLVPGLVFDACGYRVGYGAGFFDNFLAYFPGTSVGLVPSVAVSGNLLPTDAHDRPVQVLVSDSAVWRCRTREELEG